MILRDAIIAMGFGYGLWAFLHETGPGVMGPPGWTALRRWVSGEGQGVAARDLPTELPRPGGAAHKRAVTYARAAGVPAQDVPLVAAIIVVESGANPAAHNTNGEDSRGLMQVQLATAHGLHDLGRLRGMDKATLGRDLFDPVKGVKIGYAFVLYLRGIARRDGRDEDWVIRAYNGGEFWRDRGDRAAANTMAYLKKVLAVQAKIKEII